MNRRNDIIHKRPKTLIEISRACSLPMALDIVDAFKDLVKNPTDENIKYAKHVASRLSIAEGCIGFLDSDEELEKRFE